MAAVNQKGFKMGTMRSFKFMLASVLAATTLLLVGCGGGGAATNGAASSSSTTSSDSGSSTSSSGSTTSTVPTLSVCSSVTQLLLQSNVATIYPDGGTTSATFTATAVNSSNVAVTGASVVFAATDGILSAGTGITGSGGMTSVALTASTVNQANRLAIVTATCGSVVSTATVNINGTNIATSTAQSTLVVGGAAATLQATLRNALGQFMSGVTVNFVSTDGTVLAVNPASAVTNANGQASTSVSAVNVGSAAVSVSANGNAANNTFTAATGATSLQFTSPATNSVVNIGSSATVVVAVPSGATSVAFATSVGTFANGLSNQVVPVSGGVATVILTATGGGSVLITAIDNLSDSARLTLIATPPIANQVTLNAAQNSVAVSTSSGVSSVVLTARALFNNGSSVQGVAGQYISFSQSGGPGAGETFDNNLVVTNSSGVATATFLAGTQASTGSGINVVASLLSSPTVSASTNLVISGKAMSVALGQSSVIAESTDNTLYLLSFSAQVTDANNNPVTNQTVSLKLTPYAFSLGSSCSYVGTYCSEDVNGNGSLDPGEDGYRRVIPDDLSSLSCSSSAPQNTVTGTLDGRLTPANSDAGSVPATVTTDATGTAGFVLTYLKSSAYFVVPKLTATVSSNGTESSKSLIFRLGASTTDVGPPCLLPPTPYVR